MLFVIAGKIDLVAKEQVAKGLLDGLELKMSLRKAGLAMLDTLLQYYLLK